MKPALGVVLILILAGCRDDLSSDENNSSGTSKQPGSSETKNETNDENSNDGTGTTVDRSAFDETYTGVATYYDADGGGACMFDPDTSDIHIAALTKEQWASAGWCGACADVDGPDGSVRVRIVDQCPGCKHGHLDMHPEAFDMIAERRLGIVDITWHFVPCDVTGPLRYRYKDGSNPWWTGVQVRNHKIPVKSLEWSKDNGATWNPTVRQDYNYFEDASGFGDGAVRIRVTAVDDQVIEDDLPPVEADLEVAGTAQFD